MATEFSPDQTYTVERPPRATFWEHVQRWDNRAFYGRSKVYEDHMTNVGVEMDAAHDTVYDLLDQFFIDTATWALPRWENELGLVPREGASLQERTEAIRARTRGLGTATIKLLKTVAQAYAGGTIDVIEDYPNYTILIQFVDIAGVPLNEQDIKNALREIIPAHLDVEYVYRFSTWDRVDAADLTWDEVDALGLTWDEWDVAF